MNNPINTSTLTAEQALGIIASKTAPKVTRESIEAKIAGVFYSRPTGTLTIAVITMANGFTVLGKSACASPENFDADVGVRLAFDDAFGQLWALEGYLLRENLAFFRSSEDVASERASAAATDAHLRPGRHEVFPRDDNGAHDPNAHPQYPVNS